MLIEQYIFITIFFSVFIFFIYIHIAYPFWVHMPVSHTYDLHHRLRFLYNNLPIQILQQHPYKNKWNSKEVKTVSYYDLSEGTKEQVLDQLNCNYIPSDSILFAIEKKHLDTLFSGHFNTPYISFFTPLTENQKIKGCISSYPIHILYRQENQTQKISSNYIAYLACDKDVTVHKDVSRKLIATHEYNCPELRTSIMKKHVGKCSGVKPLLEFSTRLFYISLLNQKKNANPFTTLVPTQVYKENWSTISDILELLPLFFDFCAYIDVGALKARVDAGQLWIFCLKSQGEILAVYFIEDSLTLYENVNEYGGKMLTLTASICNMKKDSGREFAIGFADCLALIQKQNRDYTMLLMDDIGHNRLITKGTRGEIVKTDGAYYFINCFMEKPINRGRVFMLF